MRKIKIALLMFSLDCGGIEKAAVSILRALSPDEFDIHLIMNKKRGAFLKLVPNWVEIHELDVDEKYRKRTTLGDKKWLLYSLCHGDLKSFFEALRFHITSRSASKDRKLITKIAQLSQHINFSTEEFDFVLAYSNNEQLFHAVKCYRSKHIITWLHRNIDLNVEDSREYSFLYDRCCKIYGVSQKVVSDFIHYLPQYANRTSVHYNLIDTKLAIDLSNSIQIKRPPKKWWFLTVARLDKVKGVDIIPDIALKLKNAGIDFTWSIVGDGYMVALIQQKIKEFGLEKEVYLEGEKENPYPYYKACDLYIQPSRTEGYCISLAEARIFHKPAVVTNFSGAREQLENGKCGKIVEFGIDSLTDGIKEVIENMKLREKYIKNLSRQNIDTTDSISVLTDFIKSTIKEEQSFQA